MGSGLLEIWFGKRLQTRHRRLLGSSATWRLTRLSLFVCLWLVSGLISIITLLRTQFGACISLLVYYVLAM